MEASPDSIYEPNEAYKQSLAIALEEVFADAKPGITDESLYVEMRAWRIGQYLMATYKARELTRIGKLTHKLVGKAYNPERNSRTHLFALYRFNHDPDDNEAVAIRVNILTPGQLNVANHLLTDDETLSVFGKHGDDQKFEKFNWGLLEGMRNRLYTPSEQEYLDFLADLCSFREADRIIK